MMLGEIHSWHPPDAPTGVQAMAIDGHPLQAVRLPRAVVENGAELAELAGAGVYFLIAAGAQPRPRVFIGGTSALQAALRARLQDASEPWETAVVIALQPPRVPRFQKELTKLVQYHCHRQAIRTPTYDVVNAAPVPPSLVPAFVDRDLKLSQTAIQTLLYALGHPILGERPTR